MKCEYSPYVKVYRGGEGGSMGPKKVKRLETKGERVEKSIGIEVA